MMIIQVNKYIFLGIVLILLPNLVFSQTKKMTKDSLKLELAHFLVEKRVIENIDIYKSKQALVNFQGIYHSKTKEPLIPGMYSFSINRTHNQAFFVLLDNRGTYKILDLTNQDGLMNAINQTLIFCEEHNICSEIIRDYISRIIGVYYNINLHPETRRDPNCDKGINDIDKLP